MSRATLDTRSPVGSRLNDWSTVTEATIAGQAIRFRARAL